MLKIKYKVIKMLVFLLPIISFSESSYIDKIIYNGEQNSKIIKLNSNLKSDTKLNIKDIDLLVDNFKFAKNNDLKVNLEPSNKENYVNVVITNKKKNPLNLSIGFDNHGKSLDDGIYRYTLETGLSGLVLNENFKLTYTFVIPKNPIRQKISDLKPGETLKKDLRKARKNNNLNIEFSMPIKQFKTYLTYTYSDYKKSILGKNNAHDISGNTNKIEAKLKAEVYRNKNKKVNIIGKYSYAHKKSYVEDVLLNKDNIHNIGIGFEYTNDNVEIKSIFENTIENKKYKPSLNTNISLSKMYKQGINIGMDVSNVIEKNNSNIELKFKGSYKILYTELGINTNFKNVRPLIKVGLKKDLGIVFFDTALDYNEKLKLLFNIKINLIR
ncbi:ShlB/FhaC/HecB family hemolysin secretion/activation protein [Oceanivirga salmonicida]|uniref:ShlB/FhaC/HecB family hemolysin secretion/activation protein n=1 Tax=Oceanivirga salmonicida TaxID=1769291 RepID=UPI00082E3ADD|nr:ShlB/FhaC/HecB family hemolysin secretion/activation protein [Oceanivirga salmonicida]